MENVHFEKVQTGSDQLWGVVTIKDSQVQDCPEPGCEAIVFRNWSIKFMNYGYNYTAGISLSSFLWFSDDKL